MLDDLRVSNTLPQEASFEVFIGAGNRPRQLDNSREIVNHLQTTRDLVVWVFLGYTTLPEDPSCSSPPPEALFIPSFHAEIL